jgi:hypothetical protein
MLRRVVTTLGVILVLGLLASSSAFAEPPGANGYHSAYENLMKTMAANRAAGTQVTANTVTPSGEPNECGAPGYIQSAYNGLYVSAELGYPGNLYAMLRARSTSVGPWESWIICWFPKTETVSIFSNANKLWTTAELGYTGNQYAMLRARSTTVGPWERYRLYSFTMGQYGIESTANKLAVAAEFGYAGNEYGMLRARASEFGPWEHFGIPNP